eukprot:c21608_g2_i1 orf=1-507(-)
MQSSTANIGSILSELPELKGPNCQPKNLCPPSSNCKKQNKRWDQRLEVFFLHKHNPTRMRTNLICKQESFVKHFGSPGHIKSNHPNLYDGSCVACEDSLLPALLYCCFQMSCCPRYCHQDADLHPTDHALNSLICGDLWQIPLNGMEALFHQKWKLPGRRLETKERQST